MAGGVPAGTLSIEIVAEIAKLQDDMRKVERSLQSVDRAVKPANDNFKGMAQTGKLASHQMANLTYQLNDVAVSLASGQKPMMVFMQQGSQIGQIMAQAGVGIGGMVRQIGAAAGAFLVAHPVIAAVAVAVGAGAVAFKGLTDALEKKAPVDEYIKTLGLTDEEVKKLTDTHVTFGDVVSGTWKTIKDGLNLGGVFSTIKGWVSDTAAWMYNAFKSSVAAVYGAFKATYNNIGFIWGNLPALLGDAVRLAANTTITGLETIVNAGITGLNWLATKANEIFGATFGQIPKVNLSNLKSAYSAAGQQLGTQFQKSFNEGRAEAMAGFGTWENNIIGARNDRLLGQAEKLISERSNKKGAKGKAANDNEDAVDPVYSMLAGLKSDLPKADYNGMLEGLGVGIDNRRFDRNATISGKSMQAMREYSAEISDLGQKAFDTWTKALNATEDALVNFAMTGKLSFKDLANSIIADLVRIAIQQAIMAPLTGAFKGLFSAKGTAFEAGGVRKFATGGVVNGATPFAYSGGLGVMGEAGPEAIMPLRRLGNGRLGVEASGSSSNNVNVTVNVDGSGSQVQSEPGRAAELGRLVGVAVQAELLRQKRPGGLLAA